MRALRSWLPFGRGLERVVVDRALARDERFAQFCAFGTTFTHAAAAEAVGRFEDCRRSWLQEHEPASWHRWSGGEQHAFITDLFFAVLRDVAAGLDPQRPSTLGVSAGFDSRLLLHGLRRLGRPPRTYTFGQAGSVDVALLELLAARLGLEHLVIDTDDMAWDLEEIGRRARTRPLTPNRAIAYEAYGLGRDRQALTGYLGGAITGNTIPRVPSPTWKAAVDAFCRRNDPFGWQALLSPRRVRALLPARPLVDPRSLSPDRQLDLGYRQAQRIRPSDSSGLTHVLPYEDPRWVGFWLARSDEEIGDQALYIRFLRSLAAEEFFDLALVAEPLRYPLLRARDRLLFGAEGRDGLASVAAGARARPRDPGVRFCWFAGYANSASFRRLVETALRRLEARAVFAPSFIAAVRGRFERGEPRADKPLNGLLSVDIALEAGLFDRSGGGARAR